MTNQPIAIRARLMYNMSKVLAVFILVFALFVQSAYATHNRAGEIVYKRISDNQFLYEITIITYTKTGGPSDEADRCELDLYFGDGDMETVQRVNGPGGECPHMGEDLPGNSKMNIYRTTHVYPGLGRYEVYMQDQNRNAGVNNIPNSENVWFYISSEIVIDAISGGNNAPFLSNPPIDNGCIDQVYYHNPGAVDPDGDSLVYSFVESKTMDGMNIPGFILPNEFSGENELFEIDERTGTLTWDSPKRLGEYNVAIKIEEWRYLPESNSRIYVGHVVRDMQIDIRACDPNAPPVINNMGATCVEAGDRFVQLAVATDADGDNLEFSATGFPLEVDQGGFIDTTNPLFGQEPLRMNFIWDTRCDHVQYEPYWVYFKAKENFFTTENELVDFEELEIKVVPPAVTITEIRPAGAAMQLEWTRARCDGADGYDIYRFSDSLGFVGRDCNVGVPSALGYTKVGRTEGITRTSFTDDDGGRGLIHGQQYCYMIVATYPDRSESYASLERCGELIRDVPILNKVSVGITDVDSGQDTLAWFKPIELDVNVFRPPYKYRLSRSDNGSQDMEVIFVSEASNSIEGLDTIYIDQGINTESLQYQYSIEMLSGVDEIVTGVSRDASSIFLDSKSSDNTLSLHWSVDVPWVNSEYTVYRYDDTLAQFIEIARTADTTFVDRNLKNLRPYQYFVSSTGSYSSNDFMQTLYNRSQIHIGIPKDTQIPCTPPNRLVEGDCNLDETTIRWNNPNTSCEETDDVLGYNIYFAQRLGEEAELIQVNESAEDTTFFRQTDESISGCYFITSVDSFGNESERENPLCIDNCPVYDLPNIFTPGTDGYNDLFEPFPYKYIESIDLVIFNRWGREVFKSTDPEIDWDGTSMDSGNPVPDGTYYYLCTVNEIRLEGIVTRELRGALTIINETKPESLAK